MLVLIGVEIDFQCVLMFCVDVSEDDIGIMLLVDLFGVVCEQFELCVEVDILLIEGVVEVVILGGLEVVYVEVCLLCYCCVFMLSCEFDVFCIEV